MVRMLYVHVGARRVNSAKIETYFEGAIPVDSLYEWKHCLLPLP